MVDEHLSTDEIVSRAIKSLMPESHKPLSFNQVLMQNGIPFKTIRNITFLDWLQSVVEIPKAFSKDDLSFENSRFFNSFKDMGFVHKIPGISIETEESSNSKLEGIFKYFPFFKFGGIPFKCSHEIPWEWGVFSGIQKTEDKYMFEMHYGIKIDSVYISLNELASVANFGGVLSEIDDYFVVGNHDNTVLTIIDNDLDYCVKDSVENNECHFKPVFCIDCGVPVKYIKTADDSKPFLYKCIPERRFEYNLQRKQTLNKLNNVFKQPLYEDNHISGYPTEIDFIVKTGLRQFTFLSYDRFQNNGDFWITNVNYNVDGSDPVSVIKKYDFRNLPQNIKSIQQARANHFNKMYHSKEK